MDVENSQEKVSPEALTHYGVIKSALGAIADPDEHPVTAAATEVLYRAWRQIQRLHPDLRNVALKLGSGKELRRGDTGVRGHFAATTWQRGELIYAEVMVSGAVLGLGSQEVLKVLIHEAAHALAWVRRERARAAGAEPKDVKKLEETSDRGRYHNGLFKTICEELGLECFRLGRFGWAGTRMLDSVVELYSATLEDLTANLDLHLVPEPAADDDEEGVEGNEGEETGGGKENEGEETGGGEGALRDANLPVCGCPCGFQGRVSMKQLTTRFPLCGLCGERIVPRDVALLAAYEPALAAFLTGRGDVALTVVAEPVVAGAPVVDPKATLKSGTK